MLKPVDKGRREFAGYDGGSWVADVLGPADAPTVLLLHGGGQTRHAWGGTALALASAGYRAVALDLPGHGESAWSVAGAYRIDTLAQGMSRLWGELGTPLAVVGASLGGLISMTAVGLSDAPPIAALALVDIAPRLESVGVDRIVNFMRAHPDGFATLDDAARHISAYRGRPVAAHPRGLQKNPRLNKQGRWDIGRFLWRCWRAAAAFRPHVVIGYMKIANLVALAIGKLSGAKVVWAVRDSNTDMARYDWLSRVAFRLECLLARWTDLVIFNSQAGLKHYGARGFPKKSSIVIPNGIDVDRCKPDPEARRRVRLKWQLMDVQPLIGMVARMDAMKDHQTFLRAAARLAQQRDDVRFACIGDGTPEVRASLIEMSKHLNLYEKVIWEAGNENIGDVYCALDVMSLSSAYGEGFPNVIGEAMACGVPCVVTDVGDARQVVGSTGGVVPPSSAAEMAKKWNDMLDALPQRRSAMARACRQRIVESFSSKKLAARTESVLKTLLIRSPRPI